LAIGNHTKLLTYYVSKGVSTMRKYLQILLTPRLAEQVERHGRGHGEAVETARDDLAAYHTLLAIGARSLPGKFTLPEIEALLAITHGHMPR
jgi:hypothetical protein